MNRITLGDELERGRANWSIDPFDHCVVDNFFHYDLALALEREFPALEDPRLFRYQNALERKSTLNDWNAFPPLTYSIFEWLNTTFVKIASDLFQRHLLADQGLHGGGWHMHGPGGNLNPHLDYGRHPKSGKYRRVNLIVYLSQSWEPRHGGHLGLWSGSPDRPVILRQEIEPRFNRAVLFDTTQNSWHGLSRPLIDEPGISRKSIAAYFLTTTGSSERKRALFAPRKEQIGDPEVEETIRLRSSPETSHKVYRTK